MIFIKKIILICVALTPLLLDTHGLTGWFSGRKENSTEEDPRLSAPWVASIFKRNTGGEWRYHCSGTLTASFVVITAATCVSSKMEDNDIMFHTNYTNLKVYVGLRNISQDYTAMEDNFTQASEVSLIREHKPPQNQSTCSNLPANLAAILLRKEFTFTNYVQPASISKTPIIVGENQFFGMNNAMFAGFDLNPMIQLSKTMTQLQKFDLTIIGNNWCRNSYLRHTSYFNVVCGHISGDGRRSIPCFMEGAGLIVHVDEPGYLGPKAPFLIGVYTSNSATLSNRTDPYPLSMVKEKTQCTQSDVAFFTKHGEYFEWASSHTHCGAYPRLPCHDGSCFYTNSLCDGTANCNDESDESPEVCKYQNICRDDQFKCGNGACIWRSTVCDGDKDCLDNSDESNEERCREKAVKNNIRCSRIPKKNGVTTLCILPEYLGGTTIENCSERRVPVGTTVVQYCSKYYKGEVLGSIKCQQDSRWSNTTFLKCKPDCGFSEPINDGGNMNSNASKYGMWPWHVAIFKVNGTNEELICSGSLISTKVVLTSASCIAESGQNAPKDKATLRVVMGKQSSAYNRKEENFTQESRVRKIVIHDSYDPNTYEGDIAMIVLDTPAYITSTVGPICYSASDLFAKRNSTAKQTMSGTALGFGSDGLQPLHLLSLEKCSEGFPHLKKKTLRNNVFCARNEIGNHKNSTQWQNSICNGFSGGGFVFSQHDSYSENSRYFIQGIVSHGKNNSCNPKVFTKVAPYKTWIDETIDQPEGPKLGVWYQIVNADNSLLIWDFTDDNDGVYKLQIGLHGAPKYEKGGKFYDDSLWMIKESEETGFFTWENKNFPNSVVATHRNSLRNRQSVVLIDEKTNASRFINDANNEDNVLWRFEPRGDSAFFNIYNKRFQHNGILGPYYAGHGLHYVEIQAYLSTGLVNDQLRDSRNHKWKFIEAVPDGNEIPNTNLFTRVWYQINLTATGLMVLSDKTEEGHKKIKIIPEDASADYKKGGSNYHKALWMILKGEEPGFYTLVNKYISKAVVGTAKGSNRRWKFVVLGRQLNEKDSSTQWQFNPTPNGFYTIINSENDGYMTRSSDDNDDGSKFVETYSGMNVNQTERQSDIKYLWSFTQV